MSNSKIFTSSIVAALAGFIFGFDTVVISGANQPIKDLWHTTEISPWFHGIFIMSMALWGTVIGALFGGGPTEKFGRKKVLLWVGILFAFSALGSALAPDPYTFSFFRFIGGLALVSHLLQPPRISQKFPHQLQEDAWPRYTSSISYSAYSSLFFQITF